VRAEGEGAYLHDAGGADFGEVVATSAASADAAGVAAAGDGGSASGFAVSSLIDILDGFHNLTGIPWWITISLSTVAMRLLILPVLITQIKKAAKIGKLLPECKF
jgi:membrane protein insertase Oxa1/YidC/SpoIIIJ